jgi:hypothetical protein
MKILNDSKLIEFLDKSGFDIANRSSYGFDDYEALQFDGFDDYEALQFDLIHNLHENYTLHVYPDFIIKINNQDISIAIYHFMTLILFYYRFNKSINIDTLITLLSECDFSIDVAYSSNYIGFDGYELRMQSSPDYTILTNNINVTANILKFMQLCVNYLAISSSSLIEEDNLTDARSLCEDYSQSSNTTTDSDISAISQQSTNRRPLLRRSS